MEIVISSMDDLILNQVLCAGGRGTICKIVTFLPVVILPREPVFHDRSHRNSLYNPNYRKIAMSDKSTIHVLLSLLRFHH